MNHWGDVLLYAKKTRIHVSLGVSQTPNIVVGKGGVKMKFEPIILRVSLEDLETNFIAPQKAHRAGK